MKRSTPTLVGTAVCLTGLSTFMAGKMNTNGWDAAGIVITIVAGLLLAAGISDDM